jgi:hypothetical protein
VNTRWVRFRKTEVIEVSQVEVLDTDQPHVAGSLVIDEFLSSSSPMDCSSDTGPHDSHASERRALLRSTV